MLKRAFKNLKYGTRCFLGRYPILFNGLWLMPNFWGDLVTRTTEICIEGFPRSANTFTYAAFRYFNPGVDRIGHHIHVPMQVIRSVRWKIPCVVLLRLPQDALGSLLVSDTNLSLDLAIDSYLDFYQRIWHVREEIVVVPFEEATSHFGRVIQRVNEKFETTFSGEDVDEETRDLIFSKMKAHMATRNRPGLNPFPQKRRKERKKQLLPRILESPRIEEVRQEYERWLELAQSKAQDRGAEL